MAWIVTSWRTEALATLLDAEAREAAEEIVRAAERDARRITRAAGRETKDATAYLRELEHVGDEALAAVRARRRALRGDVAVPPDGEAEIRVERRGAKPRRASLRDSPLTELFRATATR